MQSALEAARFSLDICRDPSGKLPIVLVLVLGPLVVKSRTRATTIMVKRENHLLVLVVVVVLGLPVVKSIRKEDDEYPILESQGLFWVRHRHFLRAKSSKIEFLQAPQCQQDAPGVDGEDDYGKSGITCSSSPSCYDSQGCPRAWRAFLQQPLQARGRD
jgi:hypothetical protein